MHDELDTKIRATLEELYPSLDDVPECWDEIVASAGPVRRRRRRWRVPAFRVAAVAAVAGAVGLGAFSVLPGNGVIPGTGPSAVARAADALTEQPGTIRHVVTRITHTHPDGQITTSREETWQQNSPPYDMRHVNAGRGRGRELAEANGAVQYYDERTNTIYTTRPNVLPMASRSADMPWDRLRASMLGLVKGGGAREDGRVSVDGREAIRIVSSEWETTLLVDADTYEPIEWRATADDGSLLTTRFLTYEELPPTDANLALLSLKFQHPDATVKYCCITVEGIGSKS